MKKFFKKIINLFVELNIEFRLGSAGEEIKQDSHI